MMSSHQYEIFPRHRKENENKIHSCEYNTQDEYASLNSKVNNNEHS